MRDRTAGPGAAVAVVLLLAGCSGADPGATAGAGPVEASSVPGVDSLEVTLTQYRADVAPRRVQVKVRQAAGAEPVAVHGLSVELPGYVGPLERDDVDSTSRPGGAVDLPVPLGELDCAAADDGPARVTLLVGPDAVPWEAEVGESDGFVERFRADECARQAVLDVVPLSWSDDWTRREASDGLVADGVLRLGPVADGHEVVVAGIDSTTLYTPRPTEGSAPLPVTVAPGQQLEVPVTVAPARCDAHAVAEDKQGYLVGVRLGVDGAEPVPVTVPLTGTARDEVEAMLLDRCGLR